MNRLEANISLLFITFFASVQYVFLIWIPDSVSHFAFLCVTNLLGFIMSLAFFFGELFRLDVKQVKQSMILSGQLVVFNIFLLLGVSGLGASMTNALLSTNFIFIAVIILMEYKQIPDTGTFLGMIIALIGLLLMSEAKFSEFLNVNVLYILASNIAFAFYVVSVGKYSASSNPSIIAMGQMFFCFVFSFILWIFEVLVMGYSFSLPSTPEFWGSVIFISFFIRGLYGIVQVYAQRYVSPINTSLIFATEILMTMAVSPILSKYLGTKPDNITWPKIIGGIAIVFGVMLGEPQFLGALRRLMKGEKA